MEEWKVGNRQKEKKEESQGRKGANKGREGGIKPKNENRKGG